MILPAGTPSNPAATSWPQADPMSRLQGSIERRETIGVLLGEMSLSDHSRYQHRLHGVLLVAHGLSCRQVAAWWDVDAGQVAAWVCRFKEIGMLGLRDDELDLFSPNRIRTPDTSPKPGGRGLGRNAP